MTDVTLTCEADIYRATWPYNQRVWHIADHLCVTRNQMCTAMSNVDATKHVIQRNGLVDLDTNIS